MKKSDLVKFFTESKKFKLQKVTVDGLGDVFIRPLTVGEIEDQIANDTGTNRIAKSIARVLCNEDGERLLDPSNEDDVALIASQSWESLNPIREAIDKMNESKKPLAD